MSPDGVGLRATLVVALALILHEAVLRSLRIDGIRPDVLLAVGVVAAVVGTPEAGAAMAFAAGLLGDLFVDTPFGLSALTAAVVAYVAGTIQEGLGANHRWSVPVLTATASAAAVAAWAALGTVLGIPGLLRPRLAVVIVVVSTFNAVLAVPLTPLLRWVFRGVAGATAPGPGRGYLA